MRTEVFKRGFVSILLVLGLVFSMISVAPLSSSGDWVNRPAPGGTIIQVIPGENFLIRHTLAWDEGADGSYTVTISWANYDNNPDENFTFLMAEAYFTTSAYAGESIKADITLSQAPLGADTIWALSVSCPADQKDPRDGEFNVDIWMGAYGVGGVPHIPTDNHPIPPPPPANQFAGVIVIESSLNFWDRPPITIRVGGRGVGVSISPSENSAPPGGNVTFTVTVINKGNVPDNYVLTVSDNAVPSWAPSLSENLLNNIGPGENRTTTLTVTVPEDAVQSTKDNITVTATSQADNTVRASTTCIASVVIERGVEVYVSPLSKSGPPGEMLTYTVTVKNEGNVGDKYILSTAGAADWSPSISPSTLTLAAGASGTATLTVTIPDDAAAGDSTTITVTALGTGYLDSIICRATAEVPSPPPPPPSIAWDALITATFSSGSDDAIFSVRPDATSSFDSAYDIPEPPAPVAPSYVRIFFYYPEQIPDELHRSSLAPEDLMEWPLRIEYAESLEDITLKWNLEDVPSDYPVFLYRGENLVADMRAEQSYTFEASTGSYDFRIVVGELLPFTLELTRGWNMISFPVLPENSSPDAIFDGYYVLYRWDAVNKRYALHADSGSFVEPDPDVEAGVGYWAYVLEDENVDLLGVPVNQLTLGLRLGWNLIGPPYGGSSIADPVDNPDNSVIPWTFTWNAHEKSYRMTQQLDAGKGYWVYAMQDCELMLNVSNVSPAPPYYEVVASVDWVWDGDTIDVWIENIVVELDPAGEVYEGNLERVRFGGGIDAPEMGSDGGAEAKEFMENLIPPRTTVYLDLNALSIGGQTGRPYRGEYERLIAVIYTVIDGRWVNINAELLRWGLEKYPNFGWLKYRYYPSEWDPDGWLEDDYPYVRG